MCWANQTFAPLRQCVRLRRVALWTISFSPPAPLQESAGANRLDGFGSAQEFSATLAMLGVTFLPWILRRAENHDVR